MEEDPPDGFFTEWPRRVDAHWLLLLDGLDEVLTDKRSALTQWLQHLLAIAEAQGHHVVITSRPISDPFHEFGDKLTIYELLPFTPEQQEKLAQHWFGDRARTFLKERDRVRAGPLSGTPLLLTIAAAVYGKDERLPERRVTLYERFVSIWLEEAESRGLKDELGNYLTDLAREGLEHLALTMTEHPGETTMDALSHVITEWLRKEIPALGETIATRQGKRFMEVMSRRSGVLVRRSNDCEWVHPTFREYLAASGLARTFGARDKETWRYISLWCYPPYAQVVLFILSIWSDDGQNVEKLVKRIWKSDQPNPRERIRRVPKSLGKWCKRMIAGIRHGVGRLLITVMRAGLDNLSDSSLTVHQGKRGITHLLNEVFTYIVLFFWALGESLTQEDLKGGGGGGGHNGHLTAREFLQRALAEGVPIPTSLQKTVEDD